MWRLHDLSLPYKLPYGTVCGGKNERMFNGLFPGKHSFFSEQVPGHTSQAPDASGFYLEAPTAVPTRGNRKWISSIKDHIQLMSHSIAAELHEENSWESNHSAKSFDAACSVAINVKGIYLGALFLCFMPLASCSSHGKQANCELQKEELAQWKLTCPFQENIKKDFEVYHIRHQGLPDLVAEGTWFEGEPTVYTKRGYEYAGLFGDKVAIMITSAHHGEMFVCGLSPLLLRNAATCHVPNREETHSTKTAIKDFPSFKEGQKDEMSPTALDDTGQPLRNKGGNSKNPPAWILLMLAAFISQSFFCKA